MDASVVVPTYNRPAKLRRTVESLKNQRGIEYEIIVVDDGSESSEQEKVLTELGEYNRVTVVRQDNAGPAAARNTGWKRARADLVLFTDDDCSVSKQWIQSIINGFSSEDIAAVGGPFVPAESKLESIFARYHRYRAEDDYRPIEQERVQDNPIPHGITANIAYRRSVLEKVDGFDEDIPVAGGEDADLIRRVAGSEYRFGYIPAPVYHHDDYVLKTFLARAFRRGKGLYYLHERHGPQRGLARVLSGLIISPAFIVPAMIQSCGIDLAVVSILERIMNRLGELKAILDD